MFNKKLIIDSLKNLSKPTRMTNKNTFDLKESGSKREGFISAQEGVDTPIYKAVKTGASPIEGKGLFAEQSIRKGDVIGVSHIRKKFMKNGEEYKAPFPSTVLGYYNHSEEPNVYEVDKGDYILMVAGRDIQRGHEITSDYTKHNIGDLEVPDDFKKGGSIKRPSLPNRKSPRSYSRSFEATNKLFAKNPLFAKSKSRKNKIFDPRSQYFDNGGISKLEGDLISKVIMNRNRGVDFVDRAYALGDNPGTPMFNLPDNEQFGQNMSHKMAWGDDDNGQAWMYPTIMNPNNEAIPVPNQYADYISSEGYKNATGMNQYAEGGEPCPEGYAFNPKTGECIEWNPTVWESNDEPTSYDPVGDIIYMNPNDRSPDMTDDQYKQFYNNELEHEQLHRLQWVNGELKGRTGTPLRMPSTVDNQNYDGDHYYNRRSEEESDLGNYWMNTHPNEAPFIPGDMLYNKEINPALYDTPGMSEWEARDYEIATGDGMPSLFPKRKYGGLHKFLEGGGNPTCEKPYVWNPETNRCEKKSGCPDDFHFDLKSGRCISNYQKEGKTTVKVKPRGTNDFTIATPDQLTSKYKNDWPEDLNIEQIQNPVYFPEAQTQLTVTHPNYKNTYDDNLKDLATIRRYPDLNYKVVIDPSKPEGFNKTENIYYVNSENTHQARKYKEWEKLKNLEKQNIQKLTDAGFNIQESDNIPVMLPKVSSDYYTSAEPIVDADGNTYIPSAIYKEGWDPKKVRAEEKRAQEFYNDPEYLGYVPKDVSYEDFYKGRPGTVKENYKHLCKDCSYGHGQRYKVGNDYLYENTNLYNNLLPPKEFDWETETPLEYEYADPSIESMYPKLEFEEGVDRPSYSPSDYDMKIPTIGIGPGETKSKKHTKRLMNGKGQKYTWTDYRQTKDLDFGTREATRLIPKIVQKATGYDRNFMEGYEDKKGNYFPGEIEKAEEEGRQINFKGASSLRDRKQQKIYNEKWKNSEEENKLIRQQNEDLLKEYGLNREEYVKLYGEFKNGGGLNKFVGGGMPDPGDITCPKDYTFNFDTNKCEKNSSICPKGYEINIKTGKCVLIVGEPGFIKNDVGEWVQDVEGKTVIEDENDARYKDYLIRKDLSDISKVSDWDTRDILFGELSRSINDPRPDNYPGYFHKKYYNPETGYDFRGEYKDETNKGDYGSKVQLFNNLTANQFTNVTSEKRKKFLNDQGFPTHDKLYFNDRKDYGLKNYTPDGYIGRATLEGSGNFLTDNLYAENKTTNKFVKPRTPVIEDEIDRARLKMFFPDITDEDINRSYKFAIDNFASADKESSWDDNQEINRDIPFKDFVAATKDIPSIPGYTDDGIPYFKSESIIDSIDTDFTILPNYSEPIDKFILKKTLDDVYPTSMIEQADPSVELYTNPDAPEYYANYPDKPVYYKYNWHKSKPYNSTRPGRYKRQENTGGWNWEMSKKVKDIQKYMEGYYDDEGNYFPGEREKAEEEGRQINFQGRTSLKDRRAQKDYNQKWSQYQTDKEAIKKQNIDLLEKYGLSTEEYLKNYKKNGGLIKASDGLGVKQSLSYSPFSYNMPISLAGNTTFNPTQSITYSNPHFGSGVLNMFNKKLAKGAYGSPLELSLGRPYFTDDKSLTNSTVDYSKPWQQTYEHYNFIKSNPGFNGWENTVFQNIGDSLGVDPNLLTASDLKKYAAKEALATIKPQYKPGKPIDFNLKYSLLGMRQSTTNPTRGFGSLNVGYNPDSGWYGGGEGGMYGVIAKNMTPETYLKRGLKKKGDWAFIPSLSLGFGVRQKAGYTNEVNDKVKIYQSILEKDLQDGTANAEGYFDDHLTGDLLTSNFNYGVRPGLKFQYKPFKHSNWIGEVEGGVNADLLGGREGQMNEIKANYSPYGKISLRLPIEDQLQRLKKKIKNIDLPSPSRKYYEEEDYDDGTVEEETEKTETEETETETETNGKSTFDEDIQLNFDGQGVGKANCRDGYERPCEKCKCQKIKLPASYTDKRGTHLFGNEPLRFKQGGISLQLTKDEIQKYVDGGYVVEDLSSDPVTFKQDNETEYELGSIIEDEETKKYLESIGYTFETI